MMVRNLLLAHLNFSHDDHVKRYKYTGENNSDQMSCSIKMYLCPNEMSSYESDFQQTTLCVMFLFKGLLWIDRKSTNGKILNTMELVWPAFLCFHTVDYKRIIG